MNALGVGVHHGYFPTLLRSCIHALCSAAPSSEFPEEYSTCIFSVLQLLVSYQNGCSALIDSGLIDILLQLVKHSPKIKFVTRAIRILDHFFGFYRPSRSTLTESTMLDSLVHRLQQETFVCFDEARPTIVGIMQSTIKTREPSLDAAASTGDIQPATLVTGSLLAIKGHVMDVSADGDAAMQSVQEAAPKPLCQPDRKSLIKGIIRFLINIASEPSAMTNVRNLVEGQLPAILELLIRCSTYFGTSVWTLACKWVTNFLNAEPNMLTNLQDTGVSQAFFDVLAFKIPISAEVLTDLPSLLASLCFNERGLASFVAADPIGQLLPIFLNPEYQSSLNGDTATQLGAAIEELFRHQPTLRDKGVAAITYLLQQLVNIGNEPNINVVIG